MIDLQYPIVLFDSECILCARFSYALGKLDLNNEINRISLNEDWVYEEFDFLTKAKCKESLHVILNKNECIIGSEAIEFLVKKLPGVKKIAWLIESENGRKAINFFYNHVNNLRTNKKKCSSCNGAKK